MQKGEQMQRCVMLVEDMLEGRQKELKTVFVYVVK